MSNFETESVYSLFTITIHLTDDGCAHLDDVLEAIFSFLRFLKRVGPNEQVFGDITRIHRNGFRCPLRSSTIENVEDLVVNLSYYPAKDCLTGDTHYFEYDGDTILRAINLLNEQKFNVMVTSRHPYDENVRFELRDDQFRTEYSQKDVPEKWISLWNNAKPSTEFSLPAPNPFIADDFIIFSDANHPGPTYPTKILENDVYELWFRQDDKFLLPHAHCNIYFTTPHALSSENE